MARITLSNNVSWKSFPHQGEVVHDRVKLNPQIQLSSDNWRRNAEAVRAASRTPSGAQHAERANPVHYISGIMAGRAIKSGASSVRGFWQASVADEEKAKREAVRRTPPKPFSFPRWRSSDALSASLVASNNVEVPKDSRIPKKRLEKMKETDRLAQIEKAQIHEQAEKPRHLRKGKSLDSLILHLDHQPWYNRDKIRDSVSRESIANIAEAINRFESHDFSQPNKGPRYPRAQTRPSPSSECEFIGQLTPSQHSVRSDGSQVPSNNYYGADEYGLRTLNYSNGTTNTERSLIRCLDQMYTNEEQLFMLYIKQNPEILTSLGITCSAATRQVVENLPRIAVELRLADDNSNASITSTHQGRYLKKCHAAPSNHIYSKIRKNEPKEIYEQQNQVQAAPDKKIGSLINTEIKQLRKREEELYQSRKELGLPSLEEMMDDWKRGPQTPILRRSSCYDRANSSAATAQRRTARSSPNGP